MKTPPFEDVVQRLREVLPLAAPLKEEVETVIKGAFQDALARAELVTREEFEVQRALLLRTRARLEELETRLAELEGLGQG